MNRFEANWDRCVAQARRKVSQEESAPFGFAGRVLAALAERGSAEAIGPEIVWQRLALRSLRWIGVFLVICALLELPHLRGRKALDPAIENTVAQLVWNL
jgi:hypothetical protein